MRAYLNLSVLGMGSLLVLLLIAMGMLARNSQITIRLAPPVEAATTDLTQILAQASGSVVQIQVDYEIKSWFGRRQTHRTLGSAFAFSTDSNCQVSLIANSHVLNFYEIASLQRRGFRKLSGYTLEVRTNQGRSVAIIEVRDHREHDAALLIAPDACRDLPALTIALADVRMGEEVVALGYPLGLPLLASKGIVSSLIEGDIGTDAAIHSGSSGGPLLNLQGQVIGITTYGLRDNSAINFALDIRPLTDLQSFVPVNFNSVKRLRGYLEKTYR